MLDIPLCERRFCFYSIHFCFNIFVPFSFVPLPIGLVGKTVTRRGGCQFKYNFN